jgi:hypothetical protein
MCGQGNALTATEMFGRCRCRRRRSQVAAATRLIEPDHQPSRAAAGVIVAGPPPVARQAFRISREGMGVAMEERRVNPRVDARGDFRAGTFKYPKARKM